MHAFVVLGIVFPYQVKRSACGTSPKWPILCRVRRKTFTQSLNQFYGLDALAITQPAVSKH